MQIVNHFSFHGLSAITAYVCWPLDLAHHFMINKWYIYSILLINLKGS